MYTKNMADDTNPAAETLTAEDAAVRAEISLLTREELIARHVEAGVAKWGEAERAGLQKQAEAKSTITMYHDEAARRGYGDRSHGWWGTISYHIATGALDEGHS